MNRIYKVIWSKVKNCYIVVSEIAKSHSKPISTKLNSGKTVAALLTVAALCAGMTTSVMAADQYYSVNDMNGALSQFGNKNNDGAQGVGSVAAGAGAKVESASGSFQGAMATVVGPLNTIAAGTQTVVPFDGVANSIVGVANATQNSNATLIFGAGNAVTNSYGNVTLNYGDINPADPVDTAQKLGAAVGDSGGQVLVIGGANAVDYARFSAVTGVSNKLTGADDNTSDYNFITGAKNTLSNTDSTYVIGSNNTVSGGTSNVVIGDKRKLTSTTGDVVIGSADEEMATTVSNATILGHNANATVADGVALGSNSVASVAAGVTGTVPTGATVSDTDKATPTWKSTLGAVSVGVIGSDGTATATRQITGVAAGTQATDAVNVAQLNAVNTVVTNLTTTVDANKIHFFQANQGTSGTNYNNDGAKGTNSIAIGKASTAANDSIIIGEGAISKSGNTTSYPIRSGDIAIGMGVKVNNYVNQGGGIAIGYNARSENMAGQQERYLSLGQTEYTTGIAIGRNTYARSGSTMVGTHNYSGAIGDVTVNTTPEGMPQPNLNPFATTVGANSFSSGTMSTVMGVYSIASSNYTGNRDSSRAPKNFGATIVGSLNSIESATADSNRAGVANSIVGLANRANNANGALIFGAGNEITNSVTPIVVPMDASIASAKDLQTNLISSIRASNSAGSTMAMGGGNKADYTQLTSIMGVNNTVTGTSDDISMYNYISGFNNTATNTDNVTVTGTNRTVSGANNTIVIGSADSTVETTASDAVAVGRNSNVTVDGGVALGANSVARIDKGFVGYDQSGKITEASSITYDTEKYQSLQTQLTDTKTSISTLNTDITKLEAEIASYEKWYPDYEQDEIWQQMQAQYKAKQDELATAKTNLDTIENEIGNTLKPLTTWQATGAAVSVGDVSKGITRQITDVAAGTEDTDAVNVAQLKAAKVEVVGSGDNVTVTSDNSEGYTKYTVAAKDTKVTGLALDKNTLTLSQNGEDDLTVKNIATTTDLANNKTHYFHVNSAANGTNYDNDGAKGANSIAIGQATTNASNSIVMGTGAKMNSYVNQPGGIAIGANSFVENMSGGLERTFDFGQAGYDSFFGVPYGNPKDPSRMTTGVAIGQNTYARSGAIMLGTHNYKGALGDVTVDSANSKAPNMTIFSTTLGANSYSNGLFSTLTGAYSIASSDYSGGTANATKNLGATINGAFNSIESSTSNNESSGIGNSVVGLANRTANSNGALIFGAGNEITNSITDIDVPSLSAPSSAKGMQEFLMASIKESNSGGSTLAIGGANKANYTQQSALIGVNNTLEGTESDISQYNALTGFNNTATSVDNVTVTGSNNTVSGSTSIVNLGNENAVEDSNNTILLGDNRTVSGSDNSIILGRANKAASTTLRAAADTTLTTSADNVVVMGYNANATINDGVALGSNSVANVDKGQLGYNPSSKVLTDAEKASATWTSTLGSVAVGTSVDGAVATATRQITGVAAGTQDTDAVNVAQLKANKVTLEKGDNVTITADVADDGATTYTIASTDTDTTIVSGTVSYVDADGTLVLKDSNDKPITVTGLKDTYLVSAALENNTLTLNRNEGDPIKVEGIATTSQLSANKTHFYSVKSADETAGNYNNDGAKGANALAAGVDAVANTQNSIAIGNSAQILGNGGNSTGTSSIAIGDKAVVTTNGLDLTSIAIGKNAVVLNGSGKQDKALSFTPDNYASGSDLPINADVSPGGIAIGTNAYARTASVQIGAHTMDGYVMGGTEITGTSQANLVGMTTIGTNSYNKGAMGSMLGAYSVMTGDFDSSGGFNSLMYGSQNFGANVVGSLNSVRSAGYSGASGIANSIVGVGNIAENANGALIYGAGNKITNSVQSITGIDTLTSNLTVDQMTDAIRQGIQSSGGGGSTLAVGGGNTADYTRNTAIIGVNNTVSGVRGNVSQYNFVSGYKNTSTGGDNTTIIGTNRTLTGVDNTIVIGSADSTIETTANNAVAIGRNTNVTVDGGVALGANSIADTDKGIVGYDISGRITDAESILGSNTQYQSLQAEVTEAQTAVNDLTAKAAGYQANLDEIKSMYPDSYEQMEAYQGIQALLESTQNDLSTAQTNLTTKQSELAEAGKALYTWQSTAGAVSVGDVSKGITRQITDVAAGTADTDAVNVAQLKANKVTVAAGDNVTVTSTAADDGGTTYTVASKDTYTTKGTYDADSKKITFTQNDTEKNYEVDLSGLTDNIDKGLSFAGDSGDDINKQLGDTINIVGGATDVTTGNNIGVVSEDGKLNVRLAKDLTGLNSVAVGDAVTLGTTGLTIKNGPSVTTTGINAGNQKITNVVAGTDDTDAVNVSQLNSALKGAKHTEVTLNGDAPTAGANGALGSYIGDSNLTMAVQEVDGQKVYDLKMSKDLVAGTKPGADGKNGEAGSITIIGEPGKDGADGTNASANITVKDGEKGLDGSDGVTRIIYKDEGGKDHEIATMDDGLNFTGDTAGVTVAKKLNETLSITGGITKADQLTTEDNIGVVASDSGLKVRLAKDLQDLNSVRIGGTTTDGKGIYIANQTVTSTKDGVDPEKGNYITGLDNKTWNPTADGYVSGRAATEDQLQAAISQVTTEVGGKYTAITLDSIAPKDDGKYIGSSNLTMAVKDVNGQKVYDLKMSKDLVAGTKPGADGKNGEAGSITIIGEPGKDGTDGKNTSANITVKDGKNGLDGTDGITRIVYKDEDGTDHEIATMDDGLNFTGDTAGVTVAKKLNETLSITGGITDADQLTTVDNIGVVASDSGLKVRLAKDLNGLNSVRVGGSKAGEGIYIAKQSVNNSKGTAEEGNYITGLTNKTWNPTANGYVSGRAATEDQLNSVYDTINKNIEANKVTGGKNITVDKDNKVNLNDEITLGDAASNNVAISGTNGTITAGDGVNNKVAIDGTNSTITAGTGDNKVTVDGNSGLVTVGDTTKGAISIGNQTVTPKVVGADGTETDGTAKTGKYITGLENTTWNPTGEGYVADRAATEGQLKDIADQISDIDTAVKSSSRVFESDSGSDAGSLVTVKNTDPMKLKGGATGELSDGNIGVVNNSDKTGFDIKLSKDIKGLNSIEVNNKITIGTGDNQTIIEGDTINTGSVTTGNTTINNDGLTIVNEDSSKNITINNNNVNMGGNVIKNIGEGSEPTDAINKTQFDRAINNLGTGMNQINNRVNKLDNRVNRVGAGAAALAALHPLEFSPDAKWEVTAGVGNYRGANAIALGAFYRPNFDTMFSIGTSYGGGENMINAGVTWRIGEGETKAYPSKTVMAQEIDDLKNVVSEQQDQIEELKKLVNSLINK